jgi:hypothetical protein
MDSIATHLQNGHQARQVKKLVLAACTGTWENDPQQLANFSLATLLTDLIHHYPSLEQLNERLDRIVNNLNKKREYRLVAKLVVDQLEPVYAASQDQASHHAATLHSDINQTSFVKPSSAKPLDNVPQVTSPGPKLPHFDAPLATPAARESVNPDWKNLQFSSFSLDPNRLSPDYLEPPIYNPLLLDAETAEKTQPFSFEAASYIAPEVLHVNPDAPQTVTIDRPFQQPEDWFDTRWEIMKYANPLSVKILLYSVICQPFTFSHQDWQLLQGLSLDDLLASIVSNSFQSAEIERKLNETAIAIEQSAALSTATLTTVIPSLMQALQSLSRG